MALVTLNSYGPTGLIHCHNLFAAVRQSVWNSRALLQLYRLAVYISLSFVLEGQLKEKTLHNVPQTVCYDLPRHHTRHS